MHSFTAGAASRRVLSILCYSVLLARGALAQHEGHAAMSKPMTGALEIPMDRLGSGTTWIPDAASLPSRHFTVGSWNVMLHGFGFAQYITQRGPRGGSQFGSLNWAMLMASRALGRGIIQPRVMLSLDPWSVTGRGYPLLMQTGETYGGAAIRDRQHPHDFWMEVAAMYERPLTSNLGLLLYGGPSAEPALGAVAFMHRVSAMDDPVAPLSHHWHDATHISYGVVTAGVFGRRWKLEASRFNSREPDEDRFAIDPIRLDSWSGRLTLNPTPNWSFSAGAGHLESPEALDPTESMQRVVVSALHGRSLGPDGQWSSSIVAGANRHHGEWASSWLVESEAVFDARNTVFARVELTPRTREDLGVAGTPDESFRIAAVSLGYIRELFRVGGTTTGLGVRANVGLLPSEFESDYGSRTPLGGMVFLRVRPVRSVSRPM